jgi:uncharacterized protein YcaQ
LQLFINYSILVLNYFGGIMENKIINEVLEQTKKVNQLENVYQSIYEKFDVKIDKLKNRRDEALGMAWNAFTKEKAKLEELLKQRKEEL